jgi:mannosyltransferase OCH1-like enzyme
LYIKGGFYIDCKAIPILPLRDLIDSNEDLILCKDNGHQRIYNAYIGCIPNHPLIGKFLYSLVDNVINMNYGNGPLDITGPQFLGKIFNKLTNNYPIELGNFKFENYTNNIKYEHKNQKGFNTFDKNNSLIFIRSYSGYNKKKEFDYNYYYGQRKVFKT